MIDRYDCWCDCWCDEGGSLHEGVYPTGDYVLYTDHEAVLRAVCDALQWAVCDALQWYVDNDATSKYNDFYGVGKRQAIEALRIARGE